MERLTSFVRGLSPRAILTSALVVFWIYCWPGFVGWDTREHLLQSRAGHYTDGHPPAIALLWRIVELFIAGPLGLMLIQSITLLVGLYLLLKTRTTPRRAAWIASAIFLFPFVAGVTALVTKDALMAGPLMIGIALLLDPRPRARWWALGFLFFASLMRWNALAATFAPMVLLFQWRPGMARVKRYAIALAVWFGMTATAYEVNDVLADETEHLWYWSYAYQDIAGVIQYLPDTDDATLDAILAGVPLRNREHIQQQFRAIYDPGNFYQLMRGPKRILEIPRDQAERDAVGAAWKKLVLGHKAEYLRSRWDTWRLLMALDRPPSFSNVYVWFHVIAADYTVDELEHDAGPSRIQQKLIDASVWISLTPLYYTFVYVGALLVLLPLCARRGLEAALLLSGLGYELQWFFLAASADLRYSQWMAVCVLTTMALLAVSWADRRARR